MLCASVNAVTSAGDLAQRRREQQQRQHEREVVPAREDVLDAEQHVAADAGALERRRDAAPPGRVERPARLRLGQHALLHARRAATRAKCRCDGASSSRMRLSITRCALRRTAQAPVEVHPAARRRRRDGRRLGRAARAAALERQLLGEVARDGAAAADVAPRGRSASRVSSSSGMRSSTSRAVRLERPARVRDAARVAPARPRHSSERAAGRRVPRRPARAHGSVSRRAHVGALAQLVEVVAQRRGRRRGGAARRAPRRGSRRAAAPRRARARRARARGSPRSSAPARSTSPGASACAARVAVGPRYSRSFGGGSGIRGQRRHLRVAERLRRRPRRARRRAGAPTASVGARARLRVVARRLRAHQDLAHGEAAAAREVVAVLRVEGLELRVVRLVALALARRPPGSPPPRGRRARAGRSARDRARGRAAPAAPRRPGGRGRGACRRRRSDRGGRSRAPARARSYSSRRTALPFTEATAPSGSASRGPGRRA